MDILAQLRGAIMTMRTAKIFQHGSSQAVRLPRGLSFKADEIVIKRYAGGVLLLPKRHAYGELFALLQLFQGSIEGGEDLPP
jgi:antitoxin VapB